MEWWREDGRNRDGQKPWVTGRTRDAHATSISSTGRQEAIMDDLPPDTNFFPNRAYDEVAIGSIWKYLSPVTQCVSQGSTNIYFRQFEANPNNRLECVIVTFS